MNGATLEDIPVDVLVSQFTGYELKRLVEASPRLYQRQTEAGRQLIDEHIATLWDDLYDWLRSVGWRGSKRDLPGLQRLDLSYKQLTEVPPEIGQLYNLQRLSLWGNQLTEVPPEIGQLSNLQGLGLNGNQLTEVPPEIGQLSNLRGLDLDGNQLTEVPPEIGQLSNLQWLGLSLNLLTEENREEIKKWFPKTSIIF